MQIKYVQNKSCLYCNGYVLLCACAGQKEQQVFAWKLFSSSKCLILGQPVALH